MPLNRFYYIFEIAWKCVVKLKFKVACKQIDWIYNEFGVKSLQQRPEWALGKKSDKTEVEVEDWVFQFEWR